MDAFESILAILIVLLIVVALPLYIWWKYPKYMDTYKWVLLISLTAILFVTLTLVDDENGMLEALLCTPVIFILGYLRLFAREKIWQGLYNRIQRTLPEDQKKRSRDHIRKLGVQLPDDSDDKNEDE